MDLLKREKFYQTLTILIWFVFILSLILSGKLRTFIKKDYIPFTFLGVVILLVLLIIRFKRIKKEVSPYLNFMRGVSFLVFLFPVLLAVIVRPGNLSTFAASKRGVSMEFKSRDVNILELLKENIKNEGKYKKLNIKQLLSFAREKPEKIDGTLVSVEGLVFKKKGGPPDKFILIRFLITCCAADATPLGIEIISEEAVENLKQDTWIKVKGKVEIENKKPKIISEKIEKTKSPSDSYLY